MRLESGSGLCVDFFESMGVRQSESGRQQIYPGHRLLLNQSGRGPAVEYILICMYFLLEDEVSFWSTEWCADLLETNR